MIRSQLEPLKTFSAFVSAHPPRQRVRNLIRDTVIFFFSSFCRVPRESNWIRFPYYHHVFDDERTDFERHIRFFQNIGEIISLPDAVSLLESNTPIDGRYFCITFDDGFKNCAINAAPILLDHNAIAAFFLPTKYIGTPVDEDIQQPLAFYEPLKVVIEFLTWDDCRAMSRSGLTIGSHTVSHPHLIDLPTDEVERELRESKEKIESELEEPCEHFCCPTGRPGLDFLADRAPEIARRLGYCSFLTTRRGSAHRKPDPMMIERDHTIAAWGTYQLRYFFSK